MTKKAVPIKSFKPIFHLEQDLTQLYGLENCPCAHSAGDLALIFSDMATLDREIMIAGAIDRQARVLHCSLISVGSGEYLFLRIGDVFHGAVEHSASGIFLVHNHPSGSLEPSQADLDVTRKVAEAGLMLGYPLLEHVIVASNGHKSLMPAAKQDYAGNTPVEFLFKKAAESTSLTGDWTCPKCSGLNPLSAGRAMSVALSRNISIPVRCKHCESTTWLSFRMQEDE